jgi:heme exporter protein B
MSAWTLIRAVAYRDLRAELRNPETLLTIVLFALLTVFTFGFSFDTARTPREQVLPGILWTAFFFAGMLGLNRSAARDQADGVLTGIAMSPADRGWLYFAKILSHFVFMLVGEVVVLLLCIVWWNLRGEHLTGSFFLLLLLGTIGFLAVGIIFGVIGQKSRLKEVMLPVLLLPALFPIIVSVTQGMGLILAGDTSDKLLPWLQIVAFYDILFLGAGFLLYGLTLED